MENRYIYLFIFVLLVSIGYVFYNRRIERFEEENLIKVNDNKEENESEEENINVIEENLEKLIEENINNVDEEIQHKTPLNPFIIIQDLYNNLKKISEDVKDKRDKMQVDITKLERLSKLANESDESVENLEKQLLRVKDAQNVMDYLENKANE